MALLSYQLDEQIPKGMELLLATLFITIALCVFFLFLAFNLKHLFKSAQKFFRNYRMEQEADEAGSGISVEDSRLTGSNGSFSIESTTHSAMPHQESYYVDESAGAIVDRGNFLVPVLYDVSVSLCLRTSDMWCQYLSHSSIFHICIHIGITSAINSTAELDMSAEQPGGVNPAEEAIPEAGRLPSVSAVFTELMRPVDRRPVTAKTSMPLETSAAETIPEGDTNE